MAFFLGVSRLKRKYEREDKTDCVDSNQTTGWTGLIRVDNTVYTWMGAPVGPQLVNQTAFQYTSTKSIFTMNVAGLVQMNITFFSPITPSDFMRQSLTFSYMNVDVTSLDGVNHHVELYTDMTAGRRSWNCEWAHADFQVKSGFLVTGVLSHSGITM